MKDAKLAIDENDESLQARAKRLRQLRQFLGLSREKFIECFGDVKKISFSSLENWELSRWNGLTWSGAKKLSAELINQGLPISADWLYHGHGENPLNSLKKEVEQARFRTTNKERFQQEWQLYSQLHPKAFLHQMTHDKFKPWLNTGDYVAGEILSENEKGIGKICLVEYETAQWDVFYVTGGLDYGLYTLSYDVSLAEHLIFLQDVKVENMASVDWIRKI